MSIDVAVVSVELDKDRAVLLIDLYRPPLVAPVDGQSELRAVHLGGLVTLGCGRSGARDAERHRDDAQHHERPRRGPGPDSRPLSNRHRRSCARRHVRRDRARPRQVHRASRRTQIPPHPLRDRRATPAAEPQASGSTAPSGRGRAEVWRRSVASESGTEYRRRDGQRFQRIGGRRPADRRGVRVPRRRHERPEVQPAGPGDPQDDRRTGRRRHGVREHGQGRRDEDQPGSSRSPRSTRRRRFDGRSARRT